MRMLKKFFGKRKAINGVGDIEPILMDQIAQRFKQILDKNSGFLQSEPIIKKVFENIRGALILNSLPISEGVYQTFKDKQLHNWSQTFWESNLYVEVSIIPSSMSKAKNWFAKQNPAGYINFHNRLFTSSEAQIARQKGAEVMAHLVICVDINNCVWDFDYSILPFDLKNQKAFPMIWVPNKLLSEIEEAQLAQQTQHHR